MQGNELKAAAERLYGPKGAQTRLAEALGVDPSTVRRWISGAVPIPNPVEAAVKCFLNRSAGNGNAKALARTRKKR